MILLIKFPTRQRPEKFFQVLDLYYEKLSDLSKTKFIISCDIDDTTMNNTEVIKKLSKYENLSYYFGENHSKIEAINADMDTDSDWDICLLASDDMIPQANGYDDIIREEMLKNYKNTDGVLWFFDGIQRNLNTLCILGKRYYNRFNYIYNPAYFSLWCDNEFHCVANLLEKQTYIDRCIIKHEHPVWGYGQVDDLQKRNDTYHKDEVIFKKRKEISFSIYDYHIYSNDENNPFNKSVHEVYVINLERRKDRLVHMNEQMERFNIKFKRCDAIDGSKIGTTGAVACLRSHLGVIQDAIDNGYEKIAVFEDDVILCEDFLDRYDYYINNVPNNWDVLYLGCGYIENSPKKMYIPYIYNIKQCYGCFSMILNNRNGLFQKIIDTAKSEEKPIDDYMAFNILLNFNAYVFEPFFVKTLNTVSDISGIKESYSYEGVDRFFKEIVHLPKITINKPKQIVNNMELPIQSNKHICEEYSKNGDFIIFVAGKMIFDSSIFGKSEIKFTDDSFVFRGKSFPYRGMFIKRK